MDEGGEDFVLIVGDVGVEGLNGVVGGAIVWEEGWRGLDEGGFDGGEEAEQRVSEIDANKKQTLSPTTFAPGIFE